MISMCLTASVNSPLIELQTTLLKSLITFLIASLMYRDKRKCCFRAADGGGRPKDWAASECCTLADLSALHQDWAANLLQMLESPWRGSCWDRFSQNSGAAPECSLGLRPNSDAWLTNRYLLLAQPTALCCANWTLTALSILWKSAQPSALQAFQNWSVKRHRICYLKKNKHRDTKLNVKKYFTFF